MPDELDMIEFEHGMKGIAAMAPAYAGAVRAYYLALVAEGFDVVQALKLTIAHGYAPPATGTNGKEK